MRFRSIIPLFAALLFIPTLNLSADTTEVVASDTSEFANQQDLQALREWIATKRQVTVKQVGGDLSISGEVRVEMQHTGETKNGNKQRGPNSDNPLIPQNQFDVEVNLLMDYRTESNWAAIKVEFDNDASANLNVFDNIKIERAILGGRVFDGDTMTVDLEMGRRQMSNVYDSKIQFGSNLDGILARFDLASDTVGDFYARFSPFLIDEKRYQWGLVGEIALLNAFNTGLYAKYSIIDWDTKTFRTESTQYLNHLFRYVNSQWILGYKFVPPFMKKIWTLYSSFLINTAAKQSKRTQDSLQNKGFYAGLSVGKVRNKGDWSFDINYQYVQAQAVPVIDAGGIGRGNASKVGFYTTKLNPGRKDNVELVAFDEAVGKTNYQGIAVQLLYLLTDTITVYQSYQRAINANHSIGPKLQYHQYEIEFIYAF